MTAECTHLSYSGDEGPIRDLGRMPNRWRCDQCGHVDLDSELRELERTDPDVGDAAARLNELPDYFARTERWKEARRQVRAAAEEKPHE